MDQAFDISEVIRRTGLTARALRFYEARGLVQPLRTASGRRLYGPGELARLNHVVVLKAAGFSLADIGRILAGKAIDLGRLISAQVDALEARQAGLIEAKRLLLSAKSRVDRGEPLDAETLCSLIRSGDRAMEAENWKKVTERYFTPEELKHWREHRKGLDPDWDPAAQQAKWRELGARIEAALPLDPTSEKAEGFVHEWFKLLEPFSRVATPEMWAGARKLYQNHREWEGQADPGFSVAAREAVTAAASHMRKVGKKFGPLPPFIEKRMEAADNWRQVTERYLSEEESAQWRAAMPSGFDPMARQALWRELSARIQSAMPLDPESDQAQGFVREWFALLEPFMQVATPEMWAASQKLYARQREWEGQADPGFTAAVREAVMEVARHMRATGKDMGPLPDFVLKGLDA